MIWLNQLVDNHYKLFFSLNILGRCEKKINSQKQTTFIKQVNSESGMVFVYLNKIIIKNKIWIYFIQKKHI